MTNIKKRVSKQIYTDDRTPFDVEVDIKVEALSSSQDTDALDAAERIRGAVKDEVEKIQEDLEE